MTNEYIRLFVHSKALASVLTIVLRGSLEEGRSRSLPRVHTPTYSHVHTHTHTHAHAHTHTHTHARTHAHTHTHTHTQLEIYTDSKLTLLSAIIVIISKEKHNPYPGHIPCHKETKVRVTMYESILLPIHLSRLKT